MTDLVNTSGAWLGEAHTTSSFGSSQQGRGFSASDSQRHPFEETASRFGSAAATRPGFWRPQDLLATPLGTLLGRQVAPFFLVRRSLTLPLLTLCCEVRNGFRLLV